MSGKQQEGDSEKPAVTLPGTVEKIIPPLSSAEPPALRLTIKRCLLKKGLVAFWAGICIRLCSGGIRFIILRPAAAQWAATYAASCILIRREAYGKNRLNTSYFLAMLTSIAMQSAYRPYWARSDDEITRIQTEER